jgi:DNA-binding MarR family transcriptional regulator
VVALRGGVDGVFSMDRAAFSNGGDEERVVLNLLNSVDDGAQSQRRIAEELGIALGLVNMYLKRCVKKGYVKVSQAPARRYGYYLTPKGFAEKSRLTVQYLSDSFSFFREAREDCVSTFALAKERNLRSVLLWGRSDLAEIAVLSAVDCGVSIVAILDPNADGTQFLGKPVVADCRDSSVSFDAVMITDVTDSQNAYGEAVLLCGADRVLAPRLLGLRAAERRGVPQ